MAKLKTFSKLCMLYILIDYAIISKCNNFCHTACIRFLQWQLMLSKEFAALLIRKQFAIINKLKTRTVITPNILE